MKISVRIVIILLCMNLTVHAQNSNELPSKEYFNKSDITLMPEGEPENLETFLPLSPTVVAWGIDPIHFGMDNKKVTEHFSNYKKIGIKNLACNVWMLTATERFMVQNPELQDAVCKDIEGTPIVPNWLDSEYKGIKPWWGCTNHPKYRELIIQRASMGIESGANLLHLDDHMGTAAAANHAGGCFCKYCLNDFTKWLRNNYTKEQLARMSIPNIENFNYAETIKSAGFNTVDKYKSAIKNNQLPLRSEFMAFQLYEAAEFVHELGKIVDSITGEHIPLGVNSWNLDPTQLATSHYADYFSNEVSHFDEEDTNPPFVYLLADALQKPVFSTGTGEDWIKINENPSPTRINRWIATAYAYGHFFMYSYNKWGFSEETGTQWYQIPIKFYESYCSFVNKNKELFNDFEPFNQVGILYENEVCRTGNWEIKEICSELNYNNIPVGLAASGDSWMKHELSKDALSKFNFLIIPNETNILSNEKELINSFENNGGKVVNWNDSKEIKSIFPELITVKNASKVWTLPRINNTNPKNQKLVIHLLNQDYSINDDKMNLKSNFEVHLNNKFLNGTSFTKATLFAPGKEPVKIMVSDSVDEKVLKIPELDLWAILRLE